MHLEQQLALLGAPLTVVTFDNRGIGASSCPTDKKHYSTTIMAQDALTIMVGAACLVPSTEA